MKRKRAISSRTSMPYLVFVSHATYDKWVAKVMCEKIEALGAKTFRDDRDIEGGGTILSSIKDAIREADELMVLVSPESISRQWVTLEIGFALAYEKRVVPILFHVSPDQLPTFIRDSRAFEINEFDNYLADLLKRKKSHA